MRPIYLNSIDWPGGFSGVNIASTTSYPMPENHQCMKTLPFQRDEKKNRVTVTCADGEVSVYSHCAYCRHCRGVQERNRVVPTPQMQVLNDIRRGVAADENLMNAAMMFNTLIRDGSAIECDDDGNSGYLGLY
jgi:hypothetical protein